MWSKPYAYKTVFLWCLICNTRKFSRQQKTCLLHKLSDRVNLIDWVGRLGRKIFGFTSECTYTVQSTVKTVQNIQNANIFLPDLAQSKALIIPTLQEFTRLLMALIKLVSSDQTFNDFLKSSPTVIFNWQLLRTNFLKLKIPCCYCNYNNYQNMLEWKIKKNTLSSVPTDNF